MQLASKLAKLVRACFTGIWIESHEHTDAMTEIAQLCRQENWRLAAWDIERGLHIPGQPASTTGDAGGQDPLAAIRAVNAMASADGSALLLVQNFHRFLQSPEIVQALAPPVVTCATLRLLVITRRDSAPQDSRLGRLRAAQLGSFL